MTKNLYYRLIVFNCHPTTNRLTLPNPLHAARLLIHVQTTTTIYSGGNIMTEEKVQDYTDDKTEGHIDTREKNFDCENKDEHLGCDPGIDVAG
jgi:hypothetical protein